MVQAGLRKWFVVHFIADMVFGLPLLIAPGWFMSIFGWGTVEPFTARLVGAALLGIGCESLLGRAAGAEHYRGMLRLKLIWSGCAVVGTTATLISGAAPASGWLVVAIFALFFTVWAYYARRLGGVPTQA